MQSKALSAYKDIAFKGFKLPNEKISRQLIGFFLRDAVQTLSAYKDIAFKGFKLPSEKISRQYAGMDLFP